MKLDKIKIERKILLKITCMTSRTLYLVIIFPNSHINLTKIVIPHTKYSGKRCYYSRLYDYLLKS